MPKTWLDLGWTLLIVRGAIGIVLGLLIMIWPGATILAFILLWGIWALLDGIGSIIHAFQRGTPAVLRIAAIVLGVVSLAAAIFAIARPGVTAIVLTVLVGIWLLVRGVIEAISALANRQAGGAAKALLLASAALDVILGVLLLANPGSGALALAVGLGLLALVWGVVLVITGIVTRREVKKLETPVVPAAA